MNTVITIVSSSSGLLRNGLLGLFVIAMVVIISCTDPGGLEAVAGMEGTVLFEKAWPDSLAGAVIVAFDVELNLDSLDIDGYSVMDHFITFGSPLEPGLEEANYFIQLYPGDYMVMIIGLLVDPARLLTNEEMFQNIQNYIVIPENSAPRGIRIIEKSVNEQTDWYVEF